VAQSEAVQRYLDALERFERQREGLSHEAELALMDELSLTPLWYALTEAEMAEVERTVASRSADKPEVSHETAGRRAD
jgi:hypothetical protein